MLHWEIKWNVHKILWFIWIHRNYVTKSHRYFTKAVLLLLLKFRGGIAQGAPYIATMSDLLIHPPELSGSNQQRHLVAKEEKLGEKWLNLAYVVSVFMTLGTLTCRTTLQHGTDGFSSEAIRIWTRGPWVKAVLSEDLKPLVVGAWSK
jgi:hypothetical protein